MKKPDLIAREFVRILRRWFKQRYPKTWERKWREMQRKNATPEYGGCCASHDYHDSNVSMMEALEKHGIYVFGKRGNRPTSARVDQLWKEAWTIAKCDYLTKK